MWIVLAGTPSGGFSFYGPFESEDEARAAGRLVGIMHGGNGDEEGGLPESPEREIGLRGDPWWVFKLKQPEAVEQMSEISTESDEDETPDARI